MSDCEAIYFLLFENIVTLSITITIHGAIAYPFKANIRRGKTYVQQSYSLTEKLKNVLRGIMTSQNTYFQTPLRAV
jgi:hypothetical protein